MNLWTKIVGMSKFTAIDFSSCRTKSEWVHTLNMIFFVLPSTMPLEKLEVFARMWLDRTGLLPLNHQMHHQHPFFKNLFLFLKLFCKITLDLNTIPPALIEFRFELFFFFFSSVMHILPKHFERNRQWRIAIIHAYLPLVFVFIWSDLKSKIHFSFILFTSISPARCKQTEIMHKVNYLQVLLVQVCFCMPSSCKAF